MVDFVDFFCGAASASVGHVICGSIAWEGEDQWRTAERDWRLFLTRFLAEFTDLAVLMRSFLFFFFLTPLTLDHFH